MIQVGTPLTGHPVASPQYYGTTKLPVVQPSRFTV
jgi:hypothetical protein